MESIKQARNNTGLQQLPVCGFGNSKVVKCFTELLELSVGSDYAMFC